MCASPVLNQPVSREGFVPVKGAELYYREIGQGQPIILLHGGPDFDHAYLLPDIDRLSDSYRLIYYDQRGRGRSAGNVQPEDVTIESEIDDVDLVRAYFELESAVLLGHSWGALMAMMYALHQPHRLSHLILMNSAPASHADRLLFSQHRVTTSAADLQRMKAISSTAVYQEGDLEADAEYYRNHFRAALRRPEHLDRVLANLRLNSTPDGIRRARAIEERLYEQTWLLDQFDLLPALSQIRIPTLLIHGEYDFCPLACATHIAEAIPGARLAVLPDCGHFAYLEAPEQVREVLAGFFAGA